jgi:ABC-type Fe3+ transport system permease subunit
MAVLGGAAVLPLAALVCTVGGWAPIEDAWTAVRDQAFSSLILSLYGAALVLAASWILARRPFSRNAESLLLILLVLPGAVVGLGLAILHSKYLIPTGFYASAHAMAYALFCRTLAIPALILGAAAAAIRPRVLDAARLAGRPQWRIRLPLLAPALAASFVAAFVFCLGELSATAILNAPGWETLTMRIESLLHLGEHRLIATIALTLSGVATAVLGGAYALLRRRWRLSGIL